MDATVLIDAVVRQTTVLIAQLATAAGGRAPLAHTANQVFVDLVRELKEQGVANKVIADMFGLALRTYHDKVRRLSESSTVRGKSLWEATLAYIEDEGTVLQAAVLHRFRNDDESTVRGVLTDLVESGMIFRTGRGHRVTYRAAKPEEYQLADGDLRTERRHSWSVCSSLSHAERRAGCLLAPSSRDVFPTRGGLRIRTNCHRLRARGAGLHLHRRRTGDPSQRALRRRRLRPARARGAGVHVMCARRLLGVGDPVHEAVHDLRGLRGRGRRPQLLRSLPAR
jgi:hypothetical protein